MKLPHLEATTTFGNWVRIRWSNIDVWIRSWFGGDKIRIICSPRRRCEYVRQVLRDDGSFIDRGVWNTRREFEQEMARSGATGARGILRDSTNGEFIIIVELR